MAKEDQKDVFQDGTEGQGPMDSELFSGQVQEDLSADEIFTGDEDFQLFLANQARAQNATRRTRRVDTVPGQLPDVQIHHKNFSTLQKILAVSIIIIAAILVITFLKSYLLPGANRYTPIMVQQTPPPEPTVEAPEQPKTEQIKKPESAPTPKKPLSLKVAQDLYLQADYKKAYDVYNQLGQSLPAGADEELLNDFLKLRMALCMRGIQKIKNVTDESGKAADSDHSYYIFRTLIPSRSPVVKIMANYYLSFIELEKEQYLQARARAYQAIALIDAVDFDNTWTVSMRTNCHFLIAESMTRYILSLCDADKDLPGRLWSSFVEVDPFRSLNESQLSDFLNNGSEQLSKGLLGPQIQSLEDDGTSWSVVCYGAPVEELFERFAANSGLNIIWHLSHAKGQTFEEEMVIDVEKEAVRGKPACMFLPEITTPEFIKIAAGHVGLLARTDNEGVIDIFNPADYRSLSEHKDMLIQQAVSLWQRFLSVFHSDKRLPNAHFAVGLLKAQTDYVAEAMAEYKLVANRYTQSSLAPFALSHSSKLKASLRDYKGARQDLIQLVEQYPENELSGQACLHLAEATMKAGLTSEAGRLYSKVYHLGLSHESQIESAFGAGECFYKQKDYETAAKWLTRHIELVKTRKTKKLYSACLILGKSYLALGKIQEACDAFEAALSGPAEMLIGREYADALSSFVEAKIQQADLIEALAILENARDWRLSAEESSRLLLLKSRILRDIGLVNEAIAAIGDRAQYTLDPQAKASISLELAKCYSAKGNLQGAQKVLSESLMIVEPGPLAHEIAFELADVCLKLGQNSQAISVCSQLLDLDPTETIKQRALNILAAAYSQQKDYDRAALALLGWWNVTNTEKVISEKPVSLNQ